MSAATNSLLDLFLNPPAWWRHAVCRHAEADLWFPDKGESTVPAKRLCAGCPVRVECLEDALAAGEKFGIRGGKTVRERRMIPSGGSVCREGHDLTPMDAQDAQGHCIACTNQRAVDDGRVATMVAADAGTCVYGHDLSDGNVWRNGHRPDGRPRVVCKACSLRRRGGEAAA